MKKQLDFITLEGRNMVHDALLSGRKIMSVLLSTSTISDPRIREIENLARKNGVRIQKVSAEEIEKLSHGNVGSFFECKCGNGSRIV